MDAYPAAVSYPDLSLVQGMKKILESELPAVWFPTVRTGTGTDVFTERLVAGLRQRGLRAEITWLPLRAEYAPWTVPVPEPPAWANVAHVNTWLHARFLPRNLPVVATLHHAVHHPDARAYKGVLRTAYHRFWIAPNECRVLRRARKVIAVSQFVADSARQSLVAVPMQVIHNGVDTDVFKPGARLRRSGETFKLLYVGSWMARKGVDLLAPIMCELGGGFELRYTGGSAAERDKVHVPPNMIDIGRLQGDAAVVAAMQDADALLFPSRSEGFGLVAIEAMACGLPVIGTQGTAVAEVIIDGETGLLCQSNTIGDCVAAARRLAMGKIQRSQMQAAARQRTVESFTFADMVDGHLRLYQQLLRNQGR